MSVTGKNTLSIRKKDVQQQKSVAVGFKKTKFAHKAVAGEAGIDLSSLTAPSEMSSLGFTNPNTSDLTAANIFFYRKNVTIISSLRGELIQDLSYTIRSSSYIRFEGFTAEEGEIFIGIIDANPVTTLNVVDASPLAATGDLAIGSTDFNTGKAFKVGQTPQTVLVYRNGLIQTRNTGNSSTITDGSYYEVDSGDGTGTIIRFNNAPVGQADSIMVASVGALVESPTASQIQEIERVQGQVDALVPTVAALAGVPETTFQAAPNNVDLKQFGDRVIELESNLQAYKATVGSSVTATNSANESLGILVSTWYIAPNLALTIPSAGKWELQIEASVYIDVATTATVRAQYGFSTNGVTPASGIIRSFIGNFHYGDSRETQALIYRSEPISFNGGETIYVHGNARAWSGGATISAFNFDGTVDPEYPTKLIAIKVSE